MEMPQWEEKKGYSENWMHVKAKGQICSWALAQKPEGKGWELVLVIGLTFPGKTKVGGSSNWG